MFLGRSHYVSHIQGFSFLLLMGCRFNSFFLSDCLVFPRFSTLFLLLRVISQIPAKKVKDNATKSIRVMEFLLLNAFLYLLMSCRSDVAGHLSIANGSPHLHSAILSCSIDCTRLRYQPIETEQVCCVSTYFSIDVD